MGLDSVRDLSSRKRNFGDDLYLSRATSAERISVASLMAQQFFTGCLLHMQFRPQQLLPMAGPHHPPVAA